MGKDALISGSQICLAEIGVGSPRGVWPAAGPAFASPQHPRSVSLAPNNHRRDHLAKHKRAAPVPVRTALYRRSCRGGSPVTAWR